MSINDIYCEKCGEEFSWDYREDLIKHKHKRFITMIKGKEYLIILKGGKQYANK